MIKYYKSFDEDFVISKNQDYKLKDNYKWINHNIFYTIYSYFIYYIVLFISFIYVKLILRVTFKNKKAFKKDGSFIYLNHTQTVGDALIPFILTFPKRPYIIISSSNAGIPIIGHFLKPAGGLIIPDSIKKLVSFNKAVEKLCKKNPIIIYPEAHLWPYCTFIREFPNTSFHYPIVYNKPSYVAVNTYSKSSIFKKPKITNYLDGSYEIKNGSKKERINALHSKVLSSMIKISENSTYEYITYKKGN